MRPARGFTALIMVCVACGGAAPQPSHPAPPMATPKAMRIVREAGKPPLALVTREGDPAPAFAAFVSTAGIAPERAAVVPVALAGLFSTRIPAARVTPQADGVRVVVAGGDLARLAAALTEPVTAKTDLGLERRKVAALAGLARVPAEAAPIAACEGTLVPPADASPPSTSDVEAWRAAAVTRARVGFGVVGPHASAVRAPDLPSGSAGPAPPAPPPLSIYDASGDVRPRASSVALAWRGDLRLLGAAKALGDPRGALAALLAASDTRAHVRSVVAALSEAGACLSLRAEVDGDPSTSAGAARLATFVATATREARAAVAEDEADLASPADAEGAAEQAALVALASGREAHVDDVPAVVVGTSGSPEGARESIASAIAAAERASSARVIEARTAVERGQPSTWMLVASPCGTAGETDGDAGSSAAFVMAAAAAARSKGIAADPWTAWDGVGILAPGKDARALADALARTLLVDPVEGARAAQARLLESARPGLAGLAEAIAPGRPASLLPTGTPTSLLRLSDAAIGARADALRHGPVRLAVIANASAAQAEDAAARADPWVLREGTRSCPAPVAAAAPKPGTYAVQTDDGTSEAYVAAMVAQNDEPAATAIADALDGRGGLLEKALADGLAREYGARVLGPPGSRAIVIHIDAPSSALDAAIAQVRALLDRMRQGAIAQADVDAGRKRAEAARETRLHDPRERLVALFRGDKPAPPAALDRVRSAAATALRDEALVIVAARPRSLTVPAPHGKTP